MNRSRIRNLNNHESGTGPVVYWMSRDQRVNDNWALAYAQSCAQNRQLYVVFCLVPFFLDATQRQYQFMIRGLQQVETDLNRFGIGFTLLLGNPKDTLPTFLRRVRCGMLITDMDPLKIKRQWKQDLKLVVAHHEVDAHNCVPVWYASAKQEYGAHTIRRKLHQAYNDFSTLPKKVHKQKFPVHTPKTNWDKVYQTLHVRDIPPVNGMSSGESHARKTLHQFITKRLKQYIDSRNDPVHEATSRLSAYIHFGQLSTQRIIHEVVQSPAPERAKEAFVEQVFIRRELAENFCYYNQNYDSITCFPAWAQQTLKEHATDTRKHTYTRSQFEHAHTHDPLWNAAQLQMVTTGYMHNYLRMYWAKKILEWSPSPSQALKTAIYLNDTYELDGRDPAGYTGIAWSMGGVHDRPWPERAIFGKIRSMTFNGCKKKFDVDTFIAKYVPAEESS